MITSNHNTLQSQSDLNQNSYMQLDSKFKYGLSNASSFIKQLRLQKLGSIEDDQTVQEKTFEEQSFGDCHQFESMNKTNQNRLEDQQTGLSQFIIKKHLEETIKLYKQDLQQFEQNKQILIEAIEQLSTRISDLSNVQLKNRSLQLQNFKQMKQIESAYRQFHHLKLELQLKRLKSQRQYRKCQQKLKTLMEIMPVDVENAVAVDSWKSHYAQLEINQKHHYPQIEQQDILRRIAIQSVKAETTEVKKNKKSSKEKQGLLGDLKSFAKNFKLP